MATAIIGGGFFLTFIVVAVIAYRAQRPAPDVRRRALRRAETRRRETLRALSDVGGIVRRYRSQLDTVGNALAEEIELRILAHDTNMLDERNDDA